uniref:Protein kinase domain-containing protein n=1 Tax=Myripristis murdjan TaxID=586833 RepID=A0A667X6E9_9TELE
KNAHCRSGSIWTAILSWIVQICVALKYIHDKQLLHKDMKPEVLYTFTVMVNSLNSLNLLVFMILHVLRSDIWSMGCILYELCTLNLAFSAETTIKLIPKILGGSYPSLPECYSPELCGLLSDIFRKDPNLRPTAREILGRPFIIHFLPAKSKETVKELQTNLDKLRTVADGLERVHQGTTIGSLTGGVIGAAGGITSIVGLILAPFTLGASLVVTGVGVGVATVGGLTAGVSNIKNIVNQSSDRKAIQSLIKEFKEKTEAVVMWIQVISEALEYFSMNCDSVYSEESNDSRENVARLGLRAGRGLAGVAELVRLIRVINIGKVAAQAARAVRVAEVAGGVLAGLFVAVDVFFIAMDAKEIHHIRQARAAEAATATDRACSETMPENDTTVSEPKSDKAALVPNTEKSTTEQKAQSTAKADTVKSEIMRFVRSVRKTAEELQKVVDDLKFIVAGIPSLTSPEEHESALV